MDATSSAAMYLDRNVVDAQGNKVGSVGQVYVDDGTGQPILITVHTGFLGVKEHFAPLAGSRFNGTDLVLPFGKDVLENSPRIADSTELDGAQQQALYSYYGHSEEYPGADHSQPAAGRVRLRKYLADEE